MIAKYFPLVRYLTTFSRMKIDSAETEQKGKSTINTLLN